MKTTERIIALLQPTVEELGYELYDVEFAKEAAGWVLTVIIDKKEGITIDDCEKVSRAVDPILDEADPIEQAYFLSVSSVGLERPLKKDKDYARSIGQALDVKLYAPIDKKKEFCGTLESFDENSFTISTEKNGLITLQRKNAALVRPHIDFK